jgi:hypothetical protein
MASVWDIGRAIFAIGRSFSGAELLSRNWSMTNSRVAE